VTMATLNVQEAMGLKVDREAVATLVLPQLWAMSMGPLLNLDQFQRFMVVIRKLGNRVEEEHKQFLRDSQRLEDRSATANGASGTQPAGGVDFASLVGRANGATVKADTNADASTSWDDDPWASILNDNAPPIQTPPALPATSTAANAIYQTHSLPSSPQQSTFQARPSRLGASPVTSSSFSFPSPPVQPQRPSFTPTSSSSLSTISATPSIKPGFSQTAYTPQANLPTQQPPKPNYNITLPTSPPIPNFATPPIGFSSPAMATPSAMSSLLAPSKPSQPSWSAKKPSKDSWEDFDPLA